MKTLYQQIKIYNGKKLRSDLIAGLTVAVMLVPQGMAVAMIAGLPPIYGLYAGFIPPLIYPFFGSSHQLSVGPVAIVSILVLTGLSQFSTPGTEEFIAYAILTSLVAGVIQIILALLRLGFLINFLSHPVIMGFTSAAAIIIGLSQLKYFFGIEIHGNGSFLDNITELFQRIGETHLPSLLIGVLGILLILLLKRIKKAFPAALVVVVLATLVVQFFDLQLSGVQVVATIPKGLPEFQWPVFSLEAISKVFPLAMIICLISFIESLAIAKTISVKHGRYPIYANRELLALGLSKIGGAFFQAYPNTGSFTRSAINDDAGAKSGMASIFSAVAVGLVLFFLTDFFYYLPESILAAIVIVAVLSLFDVKEIMKIFRVDRRDFYVFLITFILTLILGVQQGVFAGIILSILIILYKTSRPHYATLGELPGTQTFKSLQRFDQAEEFIDVLVFRFDSSLYYGNAEYFYDAFNKSIEEKGDSLRLAILDASSILDIDSTGMQQLELLIQELHHDKIKFAITNCIGPVRDIMAKSGITNLVGSDNLFLTNAHAIEAYKAESIESDLSNTFASQHNIKPKKK